VLKHSQVILNLERRYGSHNPLVRLPSDWFVAKGTANITHCNRVGVAFIFIASILLLVTTISSPVIGDIAILKVMLTNFTDIRHSSVTFGAFGHCILDVPPVQ
jgi:hypothetical protein